MKDHTIAARTPAAPHAQAAPHRGGSARLGHGGVIDPHTYAAPGLLNTDPMHAYLGYLVRRLDNKIYESFIEELGGEDITPSRFTALSIIGHNPGARQVDVARALEVARPAALKVVNHLIALGLVEAHSIPSDKRIGALALTALGHAKLADYEQAVHRHEQRVFRALDPCERGELARLLDKLLAD